MLILLVCILMYDPNTFIERPFKAGLEAKLGATKAGTGCQLPSGAAPLQCYADT